MHKAFVDTIREQRLLCAGERVLVAVSGGMDSIVLLHLLHRCAADLSISLHAAHLDHGMRSQSAADADFVRQVCDALEVPCSCGLSDVPALARKRRQGLEEAARIERRLFLTRVAEQQGCSSIALGHHRGDQVETFLHRLLRGTGVSGLSAMRPRSGVFVRPLLDFPRSTIADYCRRQNLSYVEDASNQDLAFTRNRIRHTLRPLLEEINPAFDAAVDRLCRQLAAEEEVWESLEKKSMAEVMVSGGEGLSLDRPGLLALPEALLSRVLRRALQQVRGDLWGIESRHLDAIMKLLRQQKTQAGIDLPRAWVGRRYDRILLRSEPLRTEEDFSLSITGPGNWPLPGGGVLQASLESGSRGESLRAAEFDAAQLAFPLTVRNFRRGDRMHPAGLAGTKKLKEIFIDAKVDRELRRSLPLLVHDGDVLWVPGVRRSARLRPDEEADCVLRFEVSDCPAVDNWLVRSRGL